MNRRSILRLLGLAPVAVPAAVAAGGAAPPVGNGAALSDRVIRINLASGLSAKSQVRVLADGSSQVVITVQSFTAPGEEAVDLPPIDHAALSHDVQARGLARGPRALRG